MPKEVSFMLKAIVECGQSQDFEIFDLKILGFFPKLYIQIGFLHPLIEELIY